MRTARIKEIPSEQRPREKLARLGGASLSDAELLAIFLRTGRRDRNAIEVAGEMIGKRGSLLGLSRCDLRELRTLVKGVGMAKACELAAAFELGKRLARQGPAARAVDRPEAAYEILAAEMQMLRHESLRLLLLDTRLRVQHVEEVSIGSLNECIAHPREILRPAIVLSAYGFVLVHNHPSGDPAPSEADRRLTRRIKDAAQLLQIEFLDHVIIGRPNAEGPPYFSFKEHGFL